jgi:hypothetical protein
VSRIHDANLIRLLQHLVVLPLLAHKLDTDAHIIWPSLEWRIFQQSTLIQSREPGHIQDLGYFQDLGIFEK